MIGIRNEYDEIHYVKNYKDWRSIENRETNIKNGESFYFPLIEYLLQIANFLLATTFFEVLSKLGKLSLFPAIIAFFAKQLGAE